MIRATTTSYQIIHSSLDREIVLSIKCPKNTNKYHYYLPEPKVVSSDVLFGPTII